RHRHFLKSALASLFLYFFSEGAFLSLDVVNLPLATLDFLSQRPVSPFCSGSGFHSCLQVSCLTCVVTSLIPFTVLTVQHIQLLVLRSRQGQRRPSSTFCLNIGNCDCNNLNPDCPDCPCSMSYAILSPLALLTYASSRLDLCCEIAPGAKMSVNPDTSTADTLSDPSLTTAPPPDPEQTASSIPSPLISLPSPSTASGDSPSQVDPTSLAQETTATSTTVRVPTLAPVSTSLSAPSEALASHKSKAGPIAGGVIGGVALLVLLIFAFFFWRSRKRRQMAPSAEFMRHPASKVTVQPPAMSAPPLLRDMSNRNSAEDTAAITAMPHSRNIEEQHEHDPPPPFSPGAFSDPIYEKITAAAMQRREIERMQMFRHHPYRDSPTDTFAYVDDDTGSDADSRREIMSDYHHDQASAGGSSYAHTHTTNTQGHGVFVLSSPPPLQPLRRVSSSLAQ
ncbi:hypothetical protein BXZ70DRAFT_40344, partial [Cristinia sonorae]